MENGKIKKIGSIKPEEYEKAEIFDAEGRFVTPGIVEAHCHIGVSEDGARRKS